MYQDVAILALFVFAYSTVGAGIERSPVSGPILFTLFGVAVGPAGLDLLSLHASQEDVRTLAEYTLALVLFTDASRANLKVLGSSLRLPQRLLLLGLPLTILFGVAAGWLLFRETSWIELALLATMLAPTDAALGKAVISDQRVPSVIREGLNVESGLNDGICVPVLLLFLSLATTLQTTTPVLLTMQLLLQEIGIGLAVGLGTSWLADRLLRMAERNGWVGETWRQLPVVGIALGCFSLAQHFGGSGFIAAFSGGLLFGWLAGSRKQRLLLAAEGTGDTMALLTWVVFGAAISGHDFGHLSWQILLYAFLSLTVIRMLPVVVSLYGTGLNINTMLFLGWFGPRGLASIVFVVIVLDSGLGNTSTLSTTVVTTVLLSILLHGVSANPLVKRFGPLLTGARGAKPGAD